MSERVFIFPKVQPWQFINPRGEVVECAWCNKELGHEPSLGVSHGICPRHMDVEFSKIGLAIERDGDGVKRLVRLAA